MALLLAALWLPAMTHCSVEAAGLLPEFFHCAGMDHGHGHAHAHDGGHQEAPHDPAASCCQVESTGPHKEETTVTAPSAARLIFWLAAVALAPEETPALGVPAPDSSPPPDVGWQFLRRAVASPRAPSFVS